MALYSTSPLIGARRLRFDKLPSLTSSPVNFEGVFVGHAELSNSQRIAAVGGNKGAMLGKPHLVQQRSLKRFHVSGTLGTADNLITVRCSAYILAYICYIQVIGFTGFYR